MRYTVMCRLLQCRLRAVHSWLPVPATLPVLINVLYYAICCERADQRPVLMSKQEHVSDR
jgi:hypothetical protein